MMSTSHTPTDQHAEPALSESLSISHFFRTIREYKAIILLTVCAAVIAYELVALTIYLATPSERLTSQPFRLDFDGAASGKFPNGLRFSTTDVVNPAILVKVYRQNDLQRYMGFGDFGRSVFVLEANPAYDRLAADYQARLADPRLSTVDRERIQSEFEQKRDAISKNEYSLNYVRLEGVKRIPEPIVRKALADILNSWAEYAVRDQDVLAFRIAVLSPQIFSPTEVEKTDLMMAAQMLRTRTIRSIENIMQIAKLPGAELARGGNNRQSLKEVRLRMEEIQRYEVEPLVSRVRSSAVTTPATLRFLRDQLEYDQRVLVAYRSRAAALRETLATYESSAAASAASTSPQTPVQLRRAETNGETVMPQISDTFLDRMVTLASKSSDAQYRQAIVNDYRTAVEAIIPIEQTVAYEAALLEGTHPGTAGEHVDPAAVSAQVERVREELKVLVAQMNDIYRQISHNVYSQSQLMTIAAPASTRVVRAVDLKKLALWGLVVALISLPLAIIGSLLHNRVREEEAGEQFGRHEVADAATQ